MTRAVVGAGDESPYRVAIDDTVRTISSRARGHRVLAAVALLVPFVTIAVGVVRRSWAPTTFVIALVPVFAAFRCADIWLLRRWERRIIGLWDRHGLEFDEFRTAVRLVPTLPRNTLDGMLELLPGTAAALGRTMTPSARLTGAMTLHLISRCDAWCGTLTTTARSIAITAVMLAAAERTVRPWLAVAAAAVVLEASERLVRRVACRRWRRLVADVQGEDRASLAAFASEINWRAIPCGGA